MTLDQVKEDQCVRILCIHGGRGLRDRLNQLGIFEGSCVEVKRSSHIGGPLLIEYNGCRVALGRGMAQKIDVEALGGHRQHDEKEQH